MVYSFADAADTVAFTPDPTGSTLGNDPPERNDGHSERSSGREVEVVPMYDRMAAACGAVAVSGSDQRREQGQHQTHLEQLDLLVFAQHEFGCLAPLAGVLPAMLVEAVGMAVDLRDRKMLGHAFDMAR